MADLTGTTPADTYKSLLQIGDATNGVDATAKYIEDGEGTDSALAISTTAVGIGTDSPDAPLHIVGSPASTLILERDSADGTAISSVVLKDGSDDQVRISSTDSKLRLETGSGNDVRMLIDSDGKVGIGTEDPDAPLHIVDAGTADMLRLEVTDNGGSNSPDLTLYRNSASPAANDNIGVLKFRGQHSGGGTKDYANIQGVIVDPTNTSEDSKIDFSVRKSGALESRMEVGPDKVEVSSTTGGVVMPRMTTTQRNAIASPTNGEMVYDTDLNKFYGYANSAWTALH